VIKTRTDICQWA